MTIQTQILNQDYGTLLVPNGIIFDVQNYTKDVLGGPREATIEASSRVDLELWELIEFLGNPIRLLDDERGLKKVWWGKIQEISLTIGAVSVGLSLDKVYNKINVTFNEHRGAAGRSSVTSTTGWTSDGESVAAYGTKELKATISDTTLEAATSLRDRLLNDQSKPQPIVRFSDRRSQQRATIKCIGHWDTIDGKYYEQPVGNESYGGRGSETHRLGVAFTSTLVGFDAESGTLQVLDSLLTHFRRDDVILISGAANAGNNGTFTVTGVDSGELITRIASTISFRNLTTFTTPNIAFTQQRNAIQNEFISDSLGELAAYKRGDRFTVTGGVNNGRTFEVESAASADEVGIQITHNTIEFTGSSFDWIRSQTVDLRQYFQIGDLIQVTGASTPANNAKWRIDDMGTGSGWFWLHIAGDITTEVAGATVTISKGATVKVIDTTFTPAAPGTSITVTFVTYTDAEGNAHLPTNQIYDSAGGLDVFSTDDIISVAGSASNNGYFNVLRRGDDDVGVGNFLLVSQNLIDANAGPAITIKNGLRLTLLEPVVNELPGSSVSVRVKGSDRIAQSFQLWSLDGWTVDSVQAKVKKIGAPVDNLIFYLCVDSAGVPGAVIEFIAVTPSEITDEMAWLKVQFSNLNILNPATKYWLQIARFATSPHNIYEIAIDRDAKATYPRGEIMVYTSPSGWVFLNPTGDMPFQITGAWETTFQAFTILQEAEEVEGIEIKTPSGLWTPQYREGENRALSELEDLLGIGTSLGKRLMAQMDEYRYITIEEEPDPPSLTGSLHEWTMNSEGILKFKGTLVEAADCPVGMWVKLVDVIPATVNRDRIADPSLQFIEAAAYNPSTRLLTPVTRGTASADDVGGIRQG